jgi:CRISPR-associated protein Cmr3
VPLDVYQVEVYDRQEKGFVECVSKRLEIAKPSQVEAVFESNAPIDAWWPIDIPTGRKDSCDKVKEAKGWLNESQFAEYLEGKPISGDLLSSSKLFVSEERVGLALDSRRKANQQGMFYHAQFTRPCDGVGLLIEARYSETLFDASGTLTLGGEARFGHYEQVSAPDSLIKAQSGRLKVILLSPAYFSGGWRPSGGDWSQWVGRGQLVSAALGKPQAISGWDMVTQQPKPLRHFVPTGSVFYFEGAQWQGKAFSEGVTDAPYSQMGFGTVAVTSW